MSENFKIERCTFASRSSNAIQFGSETLTDFRNIEIVDAKIEHAGKAGIGITMNDEAVIENVQYRNVEIRNACAPIFIHVRDRNGVGKINICGDKTETSFCRRILTTCDSGKGCLVV
ncbi:MAG: hypothetical protein ACYS32_04365 [Planctomycetota bacterium]